MRRGGAAAAGLAGTAAEAASGPAPGEGAGYSCSFAASFASPGSFFGDAVRSSPAAFSFSAVPFPSASARRF